MRPDRSASGAVRPAGTRPPLPLPSTPGYLLTRPDDLVTLAVTFDGFTRAPTPMPDGSAAFVAGNSATLFVLFPPQATMEQRLADDYPMPADGSVSILPAGRSGLVMPVPAGQVIPLTAAGVLAALAGGAIGSDASGSTALEIPLGLVIEPVPAVAGEAVVPHHPTHPRVNGDTTALWQCDLRAPSGLQARLVRVNDSSWNLGASGGLPDYPQDTNLGPLYASQAHAIIDAAATTVDNQLVLPDVDRLTLSALGGTLTARGAWPGLTWQHDLALGRDQRVQVTQRGTLLPFGHTAILVQLVERDFDPEAAGGAAVLRPSVTLFIDPVRQFAADPEHPEFARQFPFDRVDVLVTSVSGLTNVDPDQPHFTPSIDGEAVQFPVRLFGAQGPVDVTTPLIFVGTQTSPVGLPTDPPPTPPPGPVNPHPPAPVHPPFFSLPTVPPITVPAARIDLVRSATPSPADVHLVHGLTLATVLKDGDPANLDPANYLPQISTLTIDLPAVRALLPPGASTLVQAALSQDLIDKGTQAASVLSDLQPVDANGVLTGKPFGVDFAGAGQQSGALVSPSFVADTVSRTYGPVAKKLLDNVVGSAPLPDLKSVFHDAKLLGVTLTDLLDNTLATLPIPTIVEGLRDAQQIASGTPPTVTMSWTGLPLKTADALLCVTGTTTLDLHVTAGPDASSVSCTLNDIGLALPDASAQLVKLVFRTLAFTASTGSTPSLKATGVKATLTGALELLQTLQDKVDFGGAGQLVRTTKDAITASYALSLPEVSCGLLVLTGIDFRASVVVPLDGTTPVSVAVSFASRDNPFTLAVLAFGGGGYVDLLVDGTGLKHFEGSLDFGAQLAVNFVIAQGEVHAFGGVSFAITEQVIGTTEPQITASAFLRFGGSLCILGVVTVSVEVSIDLTYADQKLTGRATLVIDVDITIWSDSVELDTGTWTIVGGGPETPSLAPLDDAEALSAWRQYREAFAA